MEESYKSKLSRLFNIPLEDLSGEHIAERSKVINDFWNANAEDLLDCLGGWFDSFPVEVPSKMMEGFNINPIFIFQTGMLFGYLLKEK